MGQYTMQLNLRKETLAKLTALHKRTKIPKVQIGNRVLDWFAEQPELMQLTILGVFSEDDQRDVTRLLLERMAGRPPTGRVDRAAS
jgi:hypothetical protein